MDYGVQRLVFAFGAVHATWTCSSTRVDVRGVRQAQGAAARELKVVTVVSRGVVLVRLRAVSALLSLTFTYTRSAAHKFAFRKLSAAKVSCDALPHGL